MGIRETMDGAAQPNSGKASFEDYKKIFGITPSIPPEERLTRLVNLCRVFGRGAHSISDNLQPTELEKRIGVHDRVPCNLDQMLSMCAESGKIITHMDSCLQEIYIIPAQFKQPELFEECSGIYLEEKKRMIAGKRALSDYLSHQIPALSS